MSIATTTRSPIPWRPALALAHGLLRSPAALTVIVACLVLEMLALAFLPLGVATSQTQAANLRSEVHWMLVTALELILLLQVRRWSLLSRALAGHQMLLIVSLSSLYLHLASQLGMCLLEFGIGWVPQPALAEYSPLVLAASLLGATLALSRTNGLGLVVAYLALAWLVPALTAPLAGSAPFGAKGLALGSASVDPFLPMLVPQLLAIGYVCLERTRR